MTGWAIAHETEAQAREASLNMCSQRGGEGCEVTFVFSNHCATVATSEAGTRVAAGSTLRKSRREARKFCASDCRILYEGCAFPR